MEKNVCINMSNGTITVPSGGEYMVDGIVDPPLSYPHGVVQDYHTALYAMTQERDALAAQVKAEAPDETRAALVAARDEARESYKNNKAFADYTSANADLAEYDIAQMGNKS